MTEATMIDLKTDWDFASDPTTSFIELVRAE
jgi:hypothetical protein